MNTSTKEWCSHPDNIQGCIEEVFGIDASDNFDWSTLVEENCSEGLLISKDTITVDEDVDQDVDSEHVCESLFCSDIDDEHLDCDHDRSAFEYADL